MICSGIASLILQWTLIASCTNAQVVDKDTQKSEQAPPSISDIPKSTDSSVAIPDVLKKKVTVDFANKPLSELVVWLRQDTGLNVTIDRQSFNGSRLLPSEPVDDGLIDAPIYLLLDRLKYKNIAWRLVDKSILFYSAEDPGQLLTGQYNVGDLFDKKLESGALELAIKETIDPQSWQDSGGKAEINVLGDVLFVRQSYANHRLLRGWLYTLRNHGRRTLVDDPPQHDAIRKQLEKVISFEFTETPLASAIDELVEKTQIDIRLDRRALAKINFHERSPVTIQVIEQKASTSLDIFLAGYDLAWKISDGVVWITSQEADRSKPRIAFFDVRDLCQNGAESEALSDAIATQSSWNDRKGHHAIAFPIHYTMVVLDSERMLDEILVLLENYRRALRDSKRRVDPETDPNAVITRYYRMPTAVAEQLQQLLPDLVASDSWKAKKQDAPGKITIIKSWREDLESGKQTSSAPPVEFSVLRVENRREIQDLLPELLSRIRHGDNIGGGGMGGMGGRFGGGMFNVPAQP
ncbi:MAG: hypothetical protein U0930_01500 [Pirellulales bacterium]